MGFIKIPKWMAESVFRHLHFSTVWAPPHEWPEVDRESFPIFYGKGESTLDHLVSFYDIMRENGVKYEDDVMKFFTLSLRGKATVSHTSHGKRGKTNYRK